MGDQTPSFDDFSVNGLSGKTVLVTGAGRGIGQACALGFAGAGAEVIAVARSARDLHELTALGEGRIQGWTADVGEEDFATRVEALSRLDVLVNNAGVNHPSAMAEVPGEVLDEMLRLNVRAVYRTSQAAVKVMLRRQEGGCIIQMSSQMGHVGAANRTAYCMTKHAVEGLTKAMAVELGPVGIRVNSVAPTFIETDLTRAMLEQPAFRRSVLESIPLGQLGEPRDVVAAVLFLSSPAARMITGTSLKVDGGWTAK